MVCFIALLMAPGTPGRHEFKFSLKQDKELDAADNTAIDKMIAGYTRK